MYGLDFRSNVMEIRRYEGLAAVAARFGVGVSSVMRWSKRLEPMVKRNKPATKIHMVALASDVQLNPDSFLHERAARWRHRHGDSPRAEAAQSGP